MRPYVCATVCNSEKPLQTAILARKITVTSQHRLSLERDRFWLIVQKKKKKGSIHSFLGLSVHPFIHSMPFLASFKVFRLHYCQSYCHLTLLFSFAPLEKLRCLVDLSGSQIKIWKWNLEHQTDRNWPLIQKQVKKTRLGCFSQRADDWLDSYQYIQQH